MCLNESAIMSVNRTYYDNLNFVRVVLSLLVTWSHCYPLTGTAEPISNLLITETAGSIAVEAFFFISGLLVVKSWLRSKSSTEFILARALRIAPALIVSLVFTITLAFISSISSNHIFLSAAVEYFFRNVTLCSGIVYELPGAYTTQHTTSVNGSLWTLPWEVRAYFVLLILGILGVFRFKLIANFILILFAVILFLPISNEFYDNKEVPFMLLSFIAGSFVGINTNPAHLPKLAVFFLISGSALIIFNQSHFGILSIIYCSVLFLGFTNHIPLLKMQSDPSFGIYVFSFPIQQFFVFKLGIISPILLFTLTIVFVYPMSLMSWTFLEKSALAARLPISRVLNKRRIKIVTNLILLLITVVFVWPVVKKIVSGIIPQQKTGIMQQNYIWGIYFSAEKTLSLKKDLATGYADKQIKIDIDGNDIVPLIGRWGDDQKIKLAIYDVKQCKFTFYNDLSTQGVFKSNILPCRSANSQPLLGDWYNEGRIRTGIYFSESGVVMLENKKGEYIEFYYGDPKSGLTAISGDWNRDGVYSIAVWNSEKKRIDILNKNESSVADSSFVLEEIPSGKNLKPFSIRLPDGTFKFGLYDQNNGLVYIVSIEDKAIIKSIEYGTKMTIAYPVFLNF